MILCENTLKPMRIAANGQKEQPPPEEHFFPFEPPALRSTSLTHPHSFARTHARTHARHEHETKPKPISRLGSAAPNKPPNLQYIYIYIYIYIPRVLIKPRCISSGLLLTNDCWNLTCLCPVRKAVTSAIRVISACTGLTHASSLEYAIR